MKVDFPIYTNRNRSEMIEECVLLLCFHLSIKSALFIDTKCAKKKKILSQKKSRTHNKLTLNDVH